MSVRELLWIADDRNRSLNTTRLICRHSYRALVETGVQRQLKPTTTRSTDSKRSIEKERAHLGSTVLLPPRSIYQTGTASRSRTQHRCNHEVTWILMMMHLVPNLSLAGAQSRSSRAARPTAAVKWLVDTPDLVSPGGMANGTGASQIRLDPRNRTK